MSKLDRIMEPSYSLKSPNVQLLVENVRRTLEGQNWTNKLLTEEEKDLIGMAVVATLIHIE